MDYPRMPLTTQAPRLGLRVLGIKVAGGGGTSDHSLLTNRDATDSHPLAAITGLVDALAAKAASSDVSTALAAKADASSVANLAASISDNRQDDFIAAVSAGLVGRGTLLAWQNFGTVEDRSVDELAITSLSGGQVWLDGLATRPEFDMVLEECRISGGVMTGLGTRVVATAGTTLPLPGSERHAVSIGYSPPVAGPGGGYPGIIEESEYCAWRLALIDQSEYNGYVGYIEQQDATSNHFATIVRDDDSIPTVIAGPVDLGRRLVDGDAITFEHEANRFRMLVNGQEVLVVSEQTHPYTELDATAIVLNTSSLWLPRVKWWALALNQPTEPRVHTCDISLMGNGTTDLDVNPAEPFALAGLVPAIGLSGKRTKVLIHDYHPDACGVWVVSADGLSLESRIDLTLPQHVGDVVDVSLAIRQFEPFTNAGERWMVGSQDGLVGTLVSDGNINTGGGVTLPIAQSDVTGLTAALAAKADTSHSHAQSDVTNLVTDLAALTSAISGKAASNHTHTPDHSPGIISAAKLAGGYSAGTPLFPMISTTGVTISAGQMLVAYGNRYARTNLTTLSVNVTATSLTGSQAITVVCYGVDEDGFPTGTPLWAENITVGTSTGWLSTGTVSLALPHQYVIGILNPSGNSGSLTVTGAQPIHGWVTTGVTANRSGLAASSHASPPDVTNFVVDSTSWTSSRWAPNQNIGLVWARRA